MNAAPLLLIEFNELCPALLDDLIAQGSLPAFARLRGQSHVFTTDAEETGERLNPWVQWVTVHTGMSADEHGVETLSEGDRVIGKNIWDILSRAGRPSWICGSMNANYVSPFNGSVLPDPWSTGIAPYPQGQFEPYFDLVRSAVQEHSNEGGGITKKSALRFLRYMLRHGLTAGTVWRTLRQLVSEKRANTRWQRAAVMDQLQFDLFRCVWRRQRPHFATFFLNSTAHFQHCYWRHWDPDAFEVKPPESELRDYADAIPFGYRQMDRLIAKLTRLVGDRATIVFCTALSQQPYLKFEKSGGRNYYRIRRPESLSEQLGLGQPYRYEPVMAEQFYLRFDDHQSAAEAATLLESYRVSPMGEKSEGDRQAISLDRRGNSLLVQCNCTQKLTDAAVMWSASTGDAVPFNRVFYHMEALKSGQHHPDGVLWIRRQGVAGGVHDEKVSLRSVAPTNLQLLGVEPPAYMDCPPLPPFATVREPAESAAAAPLNV